MTMTTTRRRFTRFLFIRLLARLVGFAVVGVLPRRKVLEPLGVGRTGRGRVVVFVFGRGGEDLGRQDETEVDGPAGEVGGLVEDLLGPVIASTSQTRVGGTSD